MEFLQVKMLSQRRGKAAMIALDGRIKDAEVYEAAIRADFLYPPI